MLKLKKVTFAYDDKPVLKNISFSVRTGDHVSLIGESGCGKSTLLRLIYGIHDTKGEIFWKEKELLGPQFNLVPGEPFIKYLAQDFDLMPPLSVADNVGKFLSNMYPRKKKKRIQELLEVVEMEDFAKVKASELSGGQQQRVALARALAKEPELLLLDEPFSHIDHFRKNNLRRRVYSYLKEQNVTCITATHDSTDALSFAERTIVLRDGAVVSDDSPFVLYNNPPNKYVASLFTDINEISLSRIDPSKVSGKKILLYPHEIKIVENSEIKATVQKSYFKGAVYLIKAELKGKTIYLENKRELNSGEKISLKVNADLLEKRIKQ